MYRIAFPKCSINRIRILEKLRTKPAYVESRRGSAFNGVRDERFTHSVRRPATINP